MAHYTNRWNGKKIEVKNNDELNELIKLGRIEPESAAFDKPAKEGPEVPAVEVVQARPVETAKAKN